MAERANELSLLFTNSISGINSTLSGLGGVLKATDGSAHGFDVVAADDVAASPTKITFAWLRPVGNGFEVAAVQGETLSVGQVISDDRAATLREALTSKKLGATPVIGPTRMLGFALGPPTAPQGTVLYREQILGPVAPPRQANTAPFHELEVALYATPHVDDQQVLVTTTSKLPMRGSVLYRHIDVGSGRWLLGVSARSALVGTITEMAPWVALLVGVAAAILIALAVEIECRRRDTTMALYTTEHRAAETLQRNLLPEIPTISGLGLAARYLAGAPGLEVGGDWFDAFPITGRRVGIAIGDVMGHDVAAAASMSQIRAALRAYAWTGEEPVAVLDRLDQFVTTFAVTPLVTVFYGVLDPPDGNGDRRLRYATAGHVSPVLIGPDGGVEVLRSSGSAILNGIPNDGRDQQERVLAAGTTLVLYTDGLVENTSDALDESIRRLADHLAVCPRGADANAVSEHVVSRALAGRLVDDVAVLVVQILAQETNGIERRQEEPASEIR